MTADPGRTIRDVPTPQGRSRVRVIGRPRNDADSAATTSPRTGIVNAATRLFSEKGYAQTTMSDIARAVGLQQSSLFYWFRI
jgi:AcrR family transcriptional regulator